MIQEILTYLTILGAVAYIVKHAISFFRPSKSQHGCSSECGGSCGLKSDIMKNLAANPNLYHNQRFNKSQNHIFSVSEDSSQQ